ncbi:MAG TPA: L-serine ammonia-lyase [Amaricoccus sp.]|uniref:L-serine ammonia-lyase n=2 Tax=Amaricoccus TaxID=56999 RepID=UPI002B6A4C61|nr:L-serine ammonia-lyase [Amaricoccus sp.]HMQ94112.1 L-serine ammonia-lyase [Amaricoccus sp.]HMR54063.1 L-serine ammonia-lyase [Amaricoccus sp.]HMR61294.1 L-serine ammonia-lyase [Amaricoccus sp.]HMU01051.1 L-serine ammonia-lyase [Amaricoccus sp.]
MFLSVFDIFKIGVGPSSSHTMGPMLAAARFLDALRDGSDRVPGAGAPARLEATLHGSLAFTGKGHATDRAVILGLLGFVPDTLDPDEAERRLSALRETGTIDASGIGPLALDPEKGVVFDYGPPLPGHANGMVLRAFDAAGNLYLTETYYSIGGGFVLTERQLKTEAMKGDDAKVDRPHPFATAAEMLAMGGASGLSIAAMKRANEIAGGAGQLDAGLDRLWSVMNACIDRGLATDGTLPGGLAVRRRARAIHQALLAERGNNIAQPHTVNDWLSVYAMAVNEENAAGSQVVTAPTNGAAGVVPAVIRYYRDHCVGATHKGIRDFLLTAAAVGGIIKTNASISGAEVGCQGEVGSAAAMAAAGLCAALGGTNAQVENAAEIALEHHLGMTCDPVKGLVQVPCIERNGLGAIKAVAAASLALRGDGTHVVPLDACIETMRQTGRDMSVKYKETSTGGLAVNLPEC